MAQEQEFVAHNDLEISGGLLLSWHDNQAATHFYISVRSVDWCFSLTSPTTMKCETIWQISF